MSDEISHAAGPRPEDRRLLTGGGRFIADIRLPGEAHGVFVRSPHARARIAGIDIAAALASPDVLAVLTAADINAADFGPLPSPNPLTGRDGTPLRVPPWPSLASGQARHVGEAVALVVGRSRAAAEDGAELVAVDFEPLVAITDTFSLTASGAPRLHESVPDNLVLDWSPVANDPVAVVADLAAAAFVAKVELISQRVAVAALEPRGAIAEYDPSAAKFTLTVSCQGAAFLRDQLLRTLDLPREQLRVIAPDVGGAFGGKIHVYPEYVALLAAARIVGRPVKWISTRSESFLSESHGRDSLLSGRLGLDRDGNFAALEVEAVANLGAWIMGAGAAVHAGNVADPLNNMYRIGRIAYRARNYLSNKAPVNAYRGAGRPEAALVVESLIEEAARLSGIDPIALRRRNLIPVAALPYHTPLGPVYDSGDFPGLFEKALRLADAGGFAARRAESERKGRLRGFGIGCFVEKSGGQPHEVAELRLQEDGTILAPVGVHNSGQGQTGTYARLLAARLGLPVERISVVQGDTDLFDKSPYPSIAARSAHATGSALTEAAVRLIAQARAAAAIRLEVAVEDVEWNQGRLEVAGTDLAIELFDLPQWSGSGMQRRSSLDTVGEVKVATAYPNGCHIAEAEIDPETGLVRIDRYTAVDDVGVALEPQLVEGQLHGGIAQGIGQVLGEQVVYDTADGQLLSGSFLDYPMPRADTVPPLRADLHCSPCLTNPVGAKGAGESGIIGALAAAANAINDALTHAGAGRITLPATPERVWRALERAQIP